MRILGSPKRTILSIVVLEALLITGIGVIIGVLGGHILSHWIGIQLQEAAGLYVNALQFWPRELTTIAVVLLLGLLSGIVPALSVYKTEPTKYMYD